MDLTDAEQKVRDWLISNGKDGYNIIVNTHTTDTNIRTIQTRNNDTTITFISNDHKGEIIDVKESTLNRRNVIEAHIPVTDSISSSTALYFELTEPITVPHIKQSSTDIELIFDVNDTSKLNGFRIQVPNFNQENIVIAFQKAHRLTNFISWKYGTYIFHKRPKQFVNGRIGGTISFTIGAAISALRDLNMNDNSLTDLVNISSKENQRLAHFTNGQRALEDANFSEAIREFYQVIEIEVDEEIEHPNSYPQVSHLINYKYLRHGVSHVELNNPTTIATLKSPVFNLTLITNPATNQEYLDPSNSLNEQILEKEATKLRLEVMNFLNAVIRI
jgi:hypothetical protein